MNKKNTSKMVHLYSVHTDAFSYEYAYNLMRFCTLDGFKYRWMHLTVCVFIRKRCGRYLSIAYVELLTVSKELKLLTIPSLSSLFSLK